jgi:uncharacterized protein YndB with AHSA1/START domain
MPIPSRAAQVFQAFVAPAITTRFWFTSSRPRTIDTQSSLD